MTFSSPFLACRWPGRDPVRHVRLRVWAQEPAAQQPPCVCVVPRLGALLPAQAVPHHRVSRDPDLVSGVRQAARVPHGPYLVSDAIV